MFQTVIRRIHSGDGKGIWAKDSEPGRMAPAKAPALLLIFHPHPFAIDAALVLEGLKYERMAATLRTGIASPFEQARKAEFRR